MVSGSLRLLSSVPRTMRQLPVLCFRARLPRHRASHRFKSESAAGFRRHPDHSRRRRSWRAAARVFV